MTSTYPDNFSTETETVLSNAVAMASDPAVKAIVWCQGIPGTAAAIDRVRETRPEMIFICGTPGEDPSVIRPKADIVFQVDEAGVAYAKKILSGDTKGLVLDDAGVTMKNHYLLMADFVTFE